MSITYTVGHSTTSYDTFLSKLNSVQVNVIADVRSTPFSKFTPQFNQDVLQKQLKRDGISYVFLGNELGGRPRRLECYTDGVADYELMASSVEFQAGLERVKGGISKGYTIALMCAEHNPLDCHRCLLVGRSLADQGIWLSHILGNGSVSSHDDIERQLLELSGLNHEDLFTPLDERISRAYRERGKKVAYVEQEQEVSAREVG
tara:strand:+ start:954 stop:1565 length:612 start_codon:yes stop_codon:yes gene_type:complete